MEYTENYISTSTVRSSDFMETTRSFLEEAGFIKKEQQDAILRLSLLTGLANQINPILEYIRKNRDGKFKFKKNLLEELMGKSVSDISKYLKDHSLEEIFSFVGRDISQDEFNELLVGFTQINWFGRKGERWEGIDILDKLKTFDDFEEIKAEVAKSGMLKEYLIEDRVENPVAILGTTIPGMEGRLSYSIEHGLDKNKNYFLVGERFLNETEKKIPELLETVQQFCRNNEFPIPEKIEDLTETHGAMYVANKVNKERELKGLSPIAFNFVNTPKCLNFENPTVSRPNTEATIRQFLIDTLDDKIDINKVIFISNEANVEAQKIAIENVLIENGFKNHTVSVAGRGCAPDTKFSTVSGPMAGRMFAAFPRQRDGRYKLSSTKENFRDRVLSYTQGGLKLISK